MLGNEDFWKYSIPSFVHSSGQKQSVNDPDRNREEGATFSCYHTSMKMS